MGGMRSVKRVWLIIILLMMGCVQSDEVVMVMEEVVGGTAVPTSTNLPTEIPSAMLITGVLVESLPATSMLFSAETVTFTPTYLPTGTPVPTEAPSATPIPSATPNLYSHLTIEALAEREYGGGLLEIVETIEETETFKRYLITYPSDGLTIYGHLTVPVEGDNFPVAIMLHGYILPDEYETVAYTTRYVDALVDAGYFVIHPNLRNYPPSDVGDNPFRIGYATDVLNLIAIIQEQSQDPTGYLRRADATDINLWGHSMGGGVALRVAIANNADYIRSVVLYGSMSGDEAQNYAKIFEWSDGERGVFELAASAEQLAEISPINHLERLRAPVSVHHSAADDLVPIAWSEALCAQLEEVEHPVECFTYYLVPHTFRGGADELFMERFIAFFNRW